MTDKHQRKQNTDYLIFLKSYYFSGKFVDYIKFKICKILFYANLAPMQDLTYVCEVPC